MNESPYVLKKNDLTEDERKMVTSLPLVEDIQPSITLVYECNQCNAVFRLEKSLKLHTEMGGCTAETNKLICPVCCLSFLHKKTLKRHLLKHGKLGNYFDFAQQVNEYFKKPPVCDRCNLKLSCPKTLTIHQRNNLCDAKHFICPKCNVAYLSKLSFTTHLEQHNKPNHIDKKRNKSTRSKARHNHFQCAYCLRSFFRKNILEKHLNVKHRQLERDFQCTTCGKVFLRQDYLKRHEKTVHNPTTQASYLCSHCGRSFARKNFFISHLMRHLKQRNYICHFCEHSVVSKSEMVVHLKIHTGIKPFMCENCAACFSRKAGLTKHERIHTDERPYPCDFCSKRFKQLEQLKNHRRLHTGEKPFCCKTCSRAFTQKADMKKHERTHSAERPYVCPYDCPSRFRQRSALNQHLKCHNRICNKTTDKKLSLLDSNQ